MAKLVIIRGLPGSGKSTMAKGMVANDPNLHHHEADMYHTDENGVYNWKRENVKVSHQWCQSQVEQSLAAGFDTIVSNTSTTKKEMQPYFDICQRLGCKYEIILCTGEYQNVHDVPPETLRRMKERFEYDI